MAVEQATYGLVLKSERMSDIPCRSEGHARLMGALTCVMKIPSAEHLDLRFLFLFREPGLKEFLLLGRQEASLDLRPCLGQGLSSGGPPLLQPEDEKVVAFSHGAGGLAVLQRGDRLPHRWRQRVDTSPALFGANVHGALLSQALEATIGLQGRQDLRGRLLVLDRIHGI